MVKRVPFFNFCFDLGCFSIPMKKYKIYYFRNLHFFCTFLAHPYVFIIPISALFDETSLPRAFYIICMLFSILTFNSQKQYIFENIPFYFATKVFFSTLFFAKKTIEMGYFYIYKFFDILSN